MKSDVSGNCLYSSFSLYLLGSNALVDELRLLTSIELYLQKHASFYTTFLQKESLDLPYCVSFESLDSNETGKTLFQKEALENCKDGKYSPYISVLALSTVVKQVVVFIILTLAMQGIKRCLTVQ